MQLESTKSKSAAKRFFVFFSVHFSVTNLLSWKFLLWFFLLERRTKVETFLCTSLLLSGTASAHSNTEINNHCGEVAVVCSGRPIWRIIKVLLLREEDKKLCSHGLQLITVYVHSESFISNNRMARSVLLSLAKCSFAVSRPHCFAECPGHKQGAAIPAILMSNAKIINYFVICLSSHHFCLSFQILRIKMVSGCDATHSALNTKVSTLAIYKHPSTS